MFIQGVGTAVPRNRYTQRECWDAICASPFVDHLSSRSRAILRKVLCSENGVDTRYFGMERLDEAFSLDPNTLHERFATQAPAVATGAALRALAQAGKSVQEVDALIISTCTGYLCPGLTSYVSEELGLRESAFLLDLVGQGCGAALPNLKTASALLQSQQAKTVLSICVEICSAAFYVDNDPGVLISACLFGDGAGAVVLSDSASADRPQVRVGDFATVLNPKDRDLLRFEQKDGMLRNVLDKSVPVLVVEHVRKVLDDLLKRSGQSQEDITGWIMHAGGRDVLAALRSGLGIPEAELRWSSEVLREHGNLSSPSVMFTLERALQNRHRPGTWFMAAFGAGISAHGARLEVSYPGE